MVLSTFPFTLIFIHQQALSSRRLQRRPRDRFPLVRRPRPLDSDSERRSRPYQPRDKTPRRPRPWNAHPSDGRPQIPRPDDSHGKTCEDGEQAAQDLVYSYYRGDCNNVLKKDFKRSVRWASRRKSLGEDRIYKKCTRDEVERALERVLMRCSTETVLYSKESDPSCAVTTKDTGTSQISWRVFVKDNDPWLQDDDETTIKVMHADKHPYYQEGETKIPLVKGEDYCLRIQRKLRRIWKWNF